MATLRDPLFAKSAVSLDEMDQLQNSGMGSLRRGWEVSRIGTERNALGIDEVAARAAGDIQRADTLRAQNEALAQAQARVAPAVQRVEDINWEPGKALDWAAAQVGQGAASMADSLAAATALGGVGRVAGMLPGAAGKAGALIGTVGGPLAAYGINQRQMAGEFANTAMADPELMARTSPQDLYKTANIVGGVAGLADTVLPTVIGRQLTGAGLRQGIGSMGPGAKTALGMAGEGLTEVGQGEVSRYAQGVLNPNRDTSGDVMDRVNEGLGGAVGAGPFTVAGAAADTAYRRAGVTADQIGAKAGEMVDLAKTATTPALDAGKKKIGDLVDLARDENGQINLAKLAEGARDNVEQAVERYKLSAEERSILSGDVPADIVDDPAKYTQWMVENDGKRIGFVAERLNDMLETDPRAEELFDRLTGTEDPVEQATIAEEAAQYILENNELEQLATRGQRAAAAFGELATKGATALGKGAVAAGKAAVGFGKAVFDGAAAEARKKNAQGEDYIAKGYEAWLERTGRAATERVVQGAKNSPAAAQAKRRGDLFGEMLAAETQASLNARGFDAARAKNVTGLLRDAGYDIAYLAANGGPKGPAAALTLGRIANTLRTAIGPRAEQVVDELAALADPKSAKMFAQLRNEVANSRTLSGQSQARQVRATAANQMLALLPSEDAQQILQSEAAGGKLNRQWLLDTVESLANGHESPQLRKALTEKFGAEALGKMLELVGENLSAPPKLMKGTVNDGGVQGEAGVNDDGEYEAEQATDFDKRQAEKTVAKGSGPKVYGFARTQGQSLRGSTDRRDPFSPISKMSPAEARAFKDENTQRAAEGLEPLAGAPVKRPGLFKLDDTLFDGGNALEKKLADLSEATKKAGHTVAARSAYEVMRDLNFSIGKIISVYRDYLRQDADAEGVGADERKALLAAAERANRAVLDSLAAKGKDGKLVKTVFRLSAGERKEIARAAEAYFKERYVAVAEKLSDAVPNRIELTELLNMGRAGAKVVEYARSQGDMQYQVLDEANLITFQSDLLKNKDRGLHIKADTLVNWVRAQRERTETRTEDDDKSNRTKNEAYLDDLMEGIAAVVDSGMVDEKMPTRINANGEYESFAKSIPPNLRLETMTYGQFKFAQEQRVKKRMDKELEDPTSGDYQERVAREQDRDFFAADPLEGTEREPAISRGQGQSMTAEEEAQFAALETAKERREFLKSLGLKQSGERFGDARAADAKTSGDNATPLDFFPKQKPEAVPDEFADQQFRTTKKAADVATGPEPKMSAMAKAPARAEAIVAALHKDFAAGVAMIESRLRSAARPESFADPKTRETSAVGGQHYVMPLAYALNLDTIGKLDLGPTEAKQLMALRAKTAQTILMADKLKENQKVALTKAMAPAVSANKVNLANYALLLQKAASAAAPVKEAARPTPAATSMPAPGLLLKTLESRLEYLTNPPDDYSTAKAREIEAWAKRQLERISEAIKGVEEGSERYDVLDEARSTARQLVKKAASVLEGDASLAEFEGTAAPEVAAKQAPKSRPQPAGADWSDTGARKLSAMSTEIHNDLQRGGFAATHDSPIRHEGKFDWRAYTGMGEGNAAFGAGTYLSTGDKVHAFYKKMMSNKTAALRDLVQAVIGSGPVTAEGKAYALEEARNKVAEYKRLLAESLYPPDAQEYRQGIEEWSQIERQISRAKIGVPFDMETKSPTYHVSVGIMKAQLLNWDKPLSEQSSYVKKRLEEVKQYLGEDVWAAATPDTRGSDVYRWLTDEFGSQAAASDYLQSLGILGHEYAASNGRDGTTPNYVIYDDSKITTNYVHFNRQGGNSRVATQAEMDEAKAYVRKVLGPQIKVEFKDITGYSGEWLDAEQAIEISATAAAGALSTAYHEALHGFFSKFVKSDPRVLDTLKSLAENEKILQRVAALLAGHPAALDQLKSGEERLAYIYQFWAAGKLDLPIGKPRTLLQKVRKFFRRVLGLVKDSERAVALFEAFHGGQLAEPSAAGKVIAKVLDEGTGVLKARRKLDGLTQWLAAKTMPAETVLATSESKAAQALAKEFFTNPGDEDAGGEAEGYLNARRRVAARYNNTFAQAVNGLTDRDMTEVAKYLQGEVELSDIPYAPHREAVAKIRGLLQRFYKYMSDERGLKLGHAGEKYYPRVWNTTLLHEKKDQFVQMLTTHYDSVLEQGAQGSKGQLSKEQVAERIWRALIDREGVNDKLDAQRQDGVLAPFFASKENRTLSWLEGEHAEPFLEKNLVATLSRYFHQGVRAAEYNERFGENGELLEARLREIMGELNELSVKKMQRKEFKDDAARAKWVNRQYRDISEAVGAMEGTLGKDISPAWRKANSWMTVYQNVRLLPLSLFASFVDPLGMVARGATMKEAYDSFLRGMKEVFANWGDMFREEPKERQADKWEKLAEHIGAVDAALFAHHVSDEYSSVYMERGAKKINDTLFKLNGMEAWNRGMRVAGVKNAVAFIERHAAGADKIHSARWLKELGLDPSNIPLDDDGQLITDKNVLMAVKGVGKSQAEREIDAIHYAINRWVEGAILTPNAAQRPAWGSDPHYSMFFHLKQFSYSFHQTILKRAVKEMNHGNLAPLGAFVWYIPTMIATDVVKGLVQGGGELPAYMKGYDLGDWVMHGVQRAGVLGAGQIGVDAAEDVFSLAGPGVEQAIDALRAPLSETTIKALPAHGLYAQALK